MARRAQQQNQYTKNTLAGGGAETPWLSASTQWLTARHTTNERNHALPLCSYSCARRTDRLSTDRSSTDESSTDMSSTDRSSIDKSPTDTVHYLHIDHLQIHHLQIHYLQVDHLRIYLQIYHLQIYYLDTNLPSCDVVQDPYSTTDPTRGTCPKSRRLYGSHAA